MAFSVDVVAQPSLDLSPNHRTVQPVSPLSPSPCPTHTRTHMKSVSGQLTLPFRAHLAVHQPVCLRRGGEEERGGPSRRRLVIALPNVSEKGETEEFRWKERRIKYIFQICLSVSINVHHYQTRTLSCNERYFRTRQRFLSIPIFVPSPPIAIVLGAKRNTHDCPCPPVRFSSRDMRPVPRSSPLPLLKVSLAMDVDAEGGPSCNRLNNPRPVSLPSVPDLRF